MTQTNVSPNSKLRVLIADDVQETRRNTRLMLSTVLGVEVVAIATNGLQAVQLAKEYHPDIVIMDINMPEMDGLTAAKEIIKAFPDTGCIIMSSERDRERATQAEQLQKKNIIYLEQLAEEYIRSRRTDDQAVDVFEQLATFPQCELRWLKTLAMLYIVRKEWGKLKNLAARLEQQN
jgi:CheY-like chemotaxis protein